MQEDKQKGRCGATGKEGDLVNFKHCMLEKSIRKIGGGLVGDWVPPKRKVEFPKTV